MAAAYDLVVTAGRVVCPAGRIDAPGTVAVRGGRIAAVGREVTAPARACLHFPGAVLLPGLIDLHAHPARGGSKYGIDPDEHFLPRGVTTVLSQGDAGAANWPAYRDETVRHCRTRVLLALNLSRRGESMPGGCFEDLADVDVDACVAAVRDGSPHVWGVAVNVSQIACGKTDPHEVTRRALAAAELTGKPLLYGLRELGQWPLADQLALLRPGDVLTYCFRGGPCSILDETGHIHPAARAARHRGVLFDTGHGMASFDFAVAEAALADGFPPDTISTDQYARHVGQDPPHDLPRTLSKLIAAGMVEMDAFAAVTARPAAALGLSGEVGELCVGSCADLTVLKYNPAAAPLRDTRGAERPGGCWEPVAAIRGGEVVL